VSCSVVVIFSIVCVVSVVVMVFIIFTSSPLLCVMLSISSSSCSVACIFCVAVPARAVVNCAM